MPQTEFSEIYVDIYMSLFGVAIRTLLPFSSTYFYEVAFLHS